MKKIKLPLTDKDIQGLKAQEFVLLSGIVYTARDQAHKRLRGLLSAGKKLPINLKNAAVYYCGPAGTPKGKVIGSCGPTTSSRMDVFTPLFLRHGLKVMIGKGSRSKDILDAIRKYKAVYFTAIGGAGAFLSRRVKSCRIKAFSDLGPEAIRCLELEDFPVMVAVDCRGKTL